MKYKQIIFDIDGTLIDTEYAVLHSLQKTVRILTGRLREFEELTFSFGLPAAEILSRLEVEDAVAGRELWDKNMEEYAYAVDVFEGMREVLDVLSERGYDLGIVTSKTKSEFEQDFGRFGINHYFKTVICADDTEEHKPMPGPLQKYMETTSSDCREVLYIGDTIYDRQCADGAGVDFAVAGWGTKFLKPGDGTYFAKTTKDLLEIL